MRTRGVVAVVVLLALGGCRSSRPLHVFEQPAVGDPAFARAVEAHTLSGVLSGNRVTVLLNGDEIFAAMLAAIRAARTTITLSNYIYEDGAVGDAFTAALAERCRAGVGVDLLVDAVGSHRMGRQARETLRRSGCHVARFHPVSSLNIRRVNRRNHRRVLVVDGRVGFTGGIGIGDQWTGDGHRAGHWRQTDVRVEGPIVARLQAAFAETWRDATSIVLSGDAYFPALEARGEVRAQSVKSSPGGGGPEAYALFVLALEGARRSIALTTPYFLPEAPIADALYRAVARGVRVSVLVNAETDNVADRLVRRASQGAYGAALEHGVRVYEYRGAMLHAKTAVVDGRWTTIGSINLDRRSFALNHELTLVVYDAATAERLEVVFRDDVRSAHELTLAEWKHRGIGRLLELFVLPLRNLL